MREASLGGNPWDNPPKIGEEFFAPVVFVTDYGYFFELTYFCHALMKSDNVNQKLQLGDRVKVRVSKVNIESRQVEVVPVSLA
jgi:ribosomal protein S1